MKLTDFLISRQQGLSKNITVDNETIYFNDIDTTLEIKGWDHIDKQKFRDVVSKYRFPENEEFSKKDWDGIRHNIPEPQVLIQKHDGPVVAMYLYQKSRLTGDTSLHIRSINKFEQMWLPYFINFKPERRDNPKVYKRQFFEYCQSMDINFKYSFADSQFEHEARVRILSFAFNSCVLLMYVFDKGNLTQDELLVFIENMKDNA
ncbi:MAG: hypothetical protein JST26_07155 [Bacteroidetes bacterium]|nr:hypothetical protein [Bacteroidota bacterium]